MFESKSAQQSEKAKVMIPVIVTLVDGETLKGSIAVPRNGRLGDVLNGNDRFLLFETNGGEPLYLSQNTIAVVQSNEMPKARQLDQSLRQIEEINPYRILRVEAGVDRAGLRTAYHRLVKHYHPDQYANTSLPSEVRAYLESVVRRLNHAYKQIEDDIDRLEKAQKVKLAPKEPATGTIRYFGQ